MGLYIFPRYRIKTIREPAERLPRMTIRAPNHSTILVPTATMISTSGVSLALSPLARSAISTLSKCERRRVRLSP
jgi:hypothetical protein